MKKVVIIAEAGVNHNGNISIAKKLVDCAEKAGVDYIKFQTFKASSLVSQTAPKASYQIINTKNSQESQFQMLKALELSYEDHKILVKYCKEKKVKFLSTAFDKQSLRYIKSLGLKLLKVPSGEITNLPYLQLAAELFDEIIISTGMANLKEIKNCLDIFLKRNISKKNITILHCNTDYPTKMEDVNLKAMNFIKDKFKTNIGYSDHTLGIEVPIAAVALGATLIEKHFTLDRNLEGPDHAASLEPNELFDMVKSIRKIEVAISGSGIKEPTKSELKNIKIARKSIFVNTDLKKNESILQSHLTMKRPGTGICPMDIDKVIGKKVNKNISSGNMLNLKDLKN